ncbi:MAG: hypothetical protein IT385_07030 [Deltaproteobacteria bacterium]|nr:hypothetical protein [Deltaproteobacteria bacterium]
MVELVVARRWDGAEVPEHARVGLEVGRDALVVTIAARYVGDPPPPGPARALHGLWEHEVVELFVAGAPFGATAPYVELELGPHGHWLAWAFAGYRARSGDVALVAAPEVTRSGDRWQGRITVPLAALPPGPWRVGAFAMHGAPPGARVHLVSTPMRGPRPDFHRVEDYAVTVES